MERQLRIFEIKQGIEDRKHLGLDHDYSPIATFPVATGLKSDNHDPLEEIVGRDIKNMMNSKIDALIGSVGNVPPEKITFSAEMFVSLGNQPEQRSGNKLVAGNSRAHTRWRVAGDHIKLRHVLPACKECLDWMEYANVGVGNDWQGEQARNVLFVPIGCLEVWIVHFLPLVPVRRSQRDIS
jgi:hypothetical protein